MKYILVNIPSIIFGCLTCFMIYKGLPHWGWFLLLTFLSRHTFKGKET